MAGGRDPEAAAAAQDVVWGTLDVLVVDAPPGAS